MARNDSYDKIHTSDNNPSDFDVFFAGLCQQRQGYNKRFLDDGNCLNETNNGKDASESLLLSQFSPQFQRACQFNNQLQNEPQLFDNKGTENLYSNNDKIAHLLQNRKPVNFCSHFEGNQESRAQNSHDQDETDMCVEQQTHLSDADDDICSRGAMFSRMPRYVPVPHLQRLYSKSCDALNTDNGRKSQCISLNQNESEENAQNYSPNISKFDALTKTYLGTGQETRTHCFTELDADIKTRQKSHILKESPKRSTHEYLRIPSQDSKWQRSRSTEVFPICADQWNEDTKWSCSYQRTFEPKSPENFRQTQDMHYQYYAGFCCSPTQNECDDGDCVDGQLFSRASKRASICLRKAMEDPVPDEQKMSVQNVIEIDKTMDLKIPCQNPCTLTSTKHTGDETSTLVMGHKPERPKSSILLSDVNDQGLLVITETASTAKVCVTSKSSQNNISDEKCQYVTGTDDTVNAENERASMENAFSDIHISLENTANVDVVDNVISKKVKLQGEELHPLRYSALHDSHDYVVDEKNSVISNEINPQQKQHMQISGLNDESMLKPLSKIPQAQQKFEVAERRSVNNDDDLPAEEVERKANNDKTAHLLQNGDPVKLCSHFEGNQVSSAQNSHDQDKTDMCVEQQTHLSDADDHICSRDAMFSRMPHLQRSPSTSCDALTADNGRKSQHIILTQREPEEIAQNYSQIYRLLWNVLKAWLFPLFSLTVYVVDIGTDIKLAHHYREDGFMVEFWITSACIVFPTIIMSIVDLSWVWIDKTKISKWRYVLGALTLGRIVRGIQHMRHIYNSITADNEQARQLHRQNAIYEKRDYHMLDFISAFAESAPQLFIQLYLFYTRNLELTALRVWSMLSSLLSIAWTYAAYYRCNKESSAGFQTIGTLSLTVLLLAVLSALAARFVCIVLFLAYYDVASGASILSVHFIVMFVWIALIQKPELEGTTQSRLGQLLYCMFFAYVSMLCFMNLQYTRARYRRLFFYTLLYAENVAMAALLVWGTDDFRPGSKMSLNLLVLPIGFSLHVTFLLIYFLRLHPKLSRNKVVAYSNLGVLPPLMAQKQ